MNLPSGCGGGGKGDNVPAKFFSLREIEFWEKRFDPDDPLLVAEIETRFKIDRSAFATIQEKLQWNLEKGFAQDPKTQELLKLAIQTTQAEIKEWTPDIVMYLVRLRSHQISWYRQVTRLQQKRNHRDLD